MLYCIAEEKKRMRDAAANAAAGGPATARVEEQADTKKKKRLVQHFVHGGGLARLNLQLDAKNKGGGGQTELLKQVELFLAGTQVHDAQHKTTVATQAGVFQLSAVYAATHAMGDDLDREVVISAARRTRSNMLQAKMAVQAKKTADRDRSSLEASKDADEGVQAAAGAGGGGAFSAEAAGDETSSADNPLGTITRRLSMAAVDIAERLTGAFVPAPAVDDRTGDGGGGDAAAAGGGEPIAEVDEGKVTEAPADSATDNMSDSSDPEKAPGSVQDGNPPTAPPDAPLDGSPSEATPTATPPDADPPQAESKATEVSDPPP
jgi:hypothetical protein